MNFEPEMGVGLACFVALLGYLALCFEHPPKKRRKRERLAHRVIAVGVAIELVCAVVTIAAVYGRHPFPIHQPPAPFVQPMPDGDLAKLASLAWMTGSSPAMTIEGEKLQVEEPWHYRSV